MNTEIIYSLLIGVTVMLAIYLVLSRAVDVSLLSIKRSLAIFSAAVGLLSMFWLQNNLAILHEYLEKIAIAGLGVVLALLAYARKSLK